MKNLSNPNDINAEFYDQIYSGEKGSAVTSAECTLISSLAGHPPKKILDIGIGTGRHAIPLAHMGYLLTGIDSSKGMLNVLVNKKISKINTKWGNIFDLKFSKTEKYNLAILMWNTFNEIALTKTDVKKLIDKVFSALEAGGGILINIENTASKNEYMPIFKFKKYIKE